jgi:hypothetical protein
MDLIIRYSAATPQIVTTSMRTIILRPGR